MKPVKGKDGRWYVFLCPKDRRVAEEVVTEDRLIRDKSGHPLMAGPYKSYDGAVKVCNDFKVYLEG